MRCNICDAILSETEIKFERRFKRYAPCRRCIDASGIAAKGDTPTDVEELEAFADSVFGEIKDEDDATYTEGETPLY